MRRAAPLGLVMVVLAAAALSTTVLSAAPTSLTGTPSGAALAEIPADYLALYQRSAAVCPGLPWTVLAAIGRVESGHGRNMGPSSAGVVGPMQFMPATWTSYGVDGDGDGVADVFNPADAVPGAARYLCANGGGDPARLRSALWHYNHSHAYVEAVLDQAARYGQTFRAVTADAAALLQNPNLTMTTAVRGDLAAGVVDARVVAILAALSARHTVHVSVLRTGHSPYVAGTSSFSNHWFGRAVDIFKIDGQPVTALSPAARIAVLEVLSIPEGSPMRPSEVGHPWADLAHLPGSFTNAAHQDHIHIGWD